MQHCVVVFIDGTEDGPCMDQRGVHHHPTLNMYENVPLPSQPVDSKTECRGAGYGPCVDRWGINATIVLHLEKLEEALT